MISAGRAAVTKRLPGADAPGAAVRDLVRGDGETLGPLGSSGRGKRSTREMAASPVDISGRRVRSGDAPVSRFGSGARHTGARPEAGWAAFLPAPVLLASAPGMVADAGRA